MNTTNEILLATKNERLSNLVPIHNINKKTEAKYRSLGYDTTLNKTTFHKLFPNIDTKYVYLNLGFPPMTVYYDESNYVYLNLNILNGQTLFPEDELLQAIQKLEQVSKDRYTAKNLTSFLYQLPKYIALEVLKKILYTEPDKYDDDLYDVFCYYYFNADYGNGIFTKDDIPLIRSLWEKTELFKTTDFPDVITVYRGEGSQSTDYQDALSWTTDKTYANFFACKNAEDNARLVSAKVKKEDIAGYIEEENEVLISSDSVYDEKIQDYYTLDLLEELSETKMMKLFTFYANRINRFLYDKREHDAMHAKRVLLHCILLGYLLDISEDDMVILAKCAIYHDICRDNDDEDTKHGLASADYYITHDEDALDNQDALDTLVVKTIVSAHCLSDEEGCTYIEKQIEDKTLQEYTKKLLNIFKDCDALDRVRFGIKALDVYQLRHEQTTLLTLLAKLIYENLE